MSKSLFQNRRESLAKGFTYIELVLVILLIGLLSLAVQPLAPLSRQSLDAAVRKVRLDVVYAQERAMLTGLNHGLKFTAGSSYIVYKGTTSTLINDPFMQTVFNDDLSEFKNVQIGSTYQVEFDPTGTPVMGGGGSVTLSNGQYTKSVTVTANTGYAEIQ